MRLLSSAILGALLLIVAPARAQKLIEKNAPLKAGERVVLRLDHANRIRLRAGAGNQLVIKATVSINQNQLNDAFLLEMDQGSGSGLSVTSKLDKQLIEKANSSSCNCPSGHFWGDTNIGKDGYSTCHGVCLAIEYDISLPANTPLEIKTIGGDIEMSGLTGTVEAKSVSGFVELRWPAKAAAELTLASVTGEVYADPSVTLDHQGRRAESVGVGYPVRGRVGEAGGATVRLESVSGDVFFKREK